LLKCKCPSVLHNLGYGGIIPNPKPRAMCLLNEQNQGE
jgi:hypothetical protein